MGLSCCRSLQDQVSAVELAKAKLRSSRTPRNLAQAVANNLDTCRDVLGTYRVDVNLTTQFRQDLEPELAEVWTAQELRHYASRLDQFTGSLKRALLRWSSRYCKEAMGL